MIELIDKLGFPIGMALALLGIVWFMIKTLMIEIKELRACIGELKTGINSLKIAIVCWLSTDGAKASGIMKMLNGDSLTQKEG